MALLLNLFLLYQDFDGDNYLGKEDLKLTVRAITANELSDEEMEFVTDKVNDVVHFLVKIQLRVLIT